MRIRIILFALLATVLITAGGQEPQLTAVKFVLRFVGT
jgi:hypothetical protein